MTPPTIDDLDSGHAEIYRDLRESGYLSSAAEEECPDCSCGSIGFTDGTLVYISAEDLDELYVADGINAGIITNDADEITVGCNCEFATPTSEPTSWYYDPDYLTGCALEFADGEEVVFAEPVPSSTAGESEVGFESIIINTRDSYDLYDEWDFQAKRITDSDSVFDDLDSGEVGIMYEKIGNVEDSESRVGYSSYYKIYSAYFEHDEPTFTVTEVDDTTYTTEPALSDKETSALDELYGPSTESLGSMLDSLIGEIALAVATEMTPTAQPINKIKSTAIDEDAFDVFGAEESKEAVTVSAVAMEEGETGEGTESSGGYET